MKSAFHRLKRAAAEWSEHRAPQMSASLAFFAMLSIAPLMVLIVAVSAWVLDEHAVREGLAEQMQGLIGRDGAHIVMVMAENASQEQTAGRISTVFSIAMLLFGATGVFAQLQSALNQLWEVAPPPEKGIFHLVRVRLLSLGLILALAFLLMVSLIASAALAALHERLAAMLPGAAALGHVLNNLLSFAIFTVLFALIYKHMPDADIPWRTVWSGALLTSFLFMIGKQLVGLYLGRSAVASTYGAAGSLVVLLLWIYYTSMIFFFGAAYTRASFPGPKPQAA
jgi:membrane protein